MARYEVSRRAEADEAALDTAFDGACCKYLLLGGAE